VCVPAQARYVGIRPKHQSVESVDRRAGGRYSKDFLRRARERTSGRMHTWSEFAMTGRVFRRWQGVPMRSGGKWAVVRTDHCPSKSHATLNTQKRLIFSAFLSISSLSSRFCFDLCLP